MNTITAPRGRADLAGLQRRLPKSHRKMISACIEQGARWDAASKNKVTIYPPAGGRPIILHSTPSDHRALLNDRAQLRRAGLVLH